MVTQAVIMTIKLGEIISMFCDKCGAQLKNENAKFCDKCGNRINKNPKIPDIKNNNITIPTMPNPAIVASSFFNDFPHFGHLVEYGIS